MQNMLFESLMGRAVPRLPFGPDDTVLVADGQTLFDLPQAMKKWPEHDERFLRALWSSTLGEFMPADQEVSVEAGASAPVAESPARASAPSLPAANRAEVSRTLSVERAELFRRKWPELNDVQIAECLEQHRAAGLNPLGNYLIPKLQPDPDTGKTALVFIATANAFMVAALGSGDFGGFDQPEFAGRDGSWRAHWPEETPPFMARCKVRRGGQEYCWPIYWRDVAQYVQTADGPKLTHFYKERWTNQFGKCALVASLRKAYADRFQRTYLRDELPIGGPAEQLATKSASDPYSQVPSYEENYSQV